MVIILTIRKSWNFMTNVALNYQKSKSKPTITSNYSWKSSCSVTKQRAIHELDINQNKKNRTTASSSRLGRIM